MSVFLSTLQTELVDEIDNIHRLLAPLAYDSDLLKRRVTVPADFCTDFASVPRLPLAYMTVGARVRGRQSCTTSSTRAVWK